MANKNKYLKHYQYLQAKKKKDKQQEVQMWEQFNKFYSGGRSNGRI